MMNDHVTPSERLRGLTPAGQFWIACTMLVAFIVFISVSTCYAMPYAERRITYLSVLCPPNWRATVSQRYDDRDSRGRIVHSTWITRCY